MKSPVIYQTDLAKRNARDLEAIYSIITTYYEGVEEAKVHLLEEVFHSAWLMKDMDTPNGDLLHVEDKPTFKKRVSDHGPYPGYAQERIIVNLDLAYEKMAFVRVNKDANRSCTCFFLYKFGNDWQLMDKVWPNVRKPIPSGNDRIRVVVGPHRLAVVGGQQNICADS